MNSWMSYCQKKGLCPMCVKSLCVCTKGHRIRGGLGPPQGYGNWHRFDVGEGVRAHFPDGNGIVEHGRIGAVVQHSGNPNDPVWVRWEGDDHDFPMHPRYLRRQASSGYEAEYNDSPRNVATNEQSDELGGFVNKGLKRVVLSKSFDQREPGRRFKVGSSVVVNNSSSPHHGGTGKVNQLNEDEDDDRVCVFLNGHGGVMLHSSDLVPEELYGGEE